MSGLTQALRAGLGLGLGHSRGRGGGLLLKDLIPQGGRSIATHTLKVGKDRNLAYKEIPGHSEPTVVYVPGLHSYSNMNGMMSNCLLR